MAAQRVSRLQQRMLRLLMADHHHTQGGTSMDHSERTRAVGGNKGNISHSLRPLEARGWIAAERTPSGLADSLDLTSEGLEKASES